MNDSKFQLDLNRADFKVDLPTLDEVLSDQYTYHAWTPAQQTAGDIIREAIQEAARAVILNAPPCADRSTALRKLREARMDANSAITHGGQY